VRAQIALPVSTAVLVCHPAAIALKVRVPHLDQVDVPIVELVNTAVLVAYVRTVQRAHRLHQDQQAAQIAWQDLTR
jgi:hypothetical protein